MSAIQTNATSFNPNKLNLVQVATYERLIHAPLERVWENVLDWEHLPWLHKTSFDYVELVDAGDWGWRTWSNPERTGHVELTRADKDSYVARTYQGDRQLSEIWTHLSANNSAHATDVSVQFHFADVEPSGIQNLGDYITTLYTRLWDEDEAMMMERHQRLLETREADEEKNLGNAEEIRQRLAGDSQMIFQLARREYQLRLVDEEIIVHSTICPHLLGPLTDSDMSDGRLACPWHGYQFDIATGDCVFPADANCRLSKPPMLSIESGNLIARSIR